MLIIDSCLHFSLHIYNELLPAQHNIYSSCRRRINSAEVSELLTSLQNSKCKICEGLRQNDYLNSIAKDPVDQSHSSFSVSDVVCHIVLHQQDVIKDYFGHQRTQRGRSGNPSAQQFGYNDMTIAAKRDIAQSVSGNTGGRYGKAKWYTVFDKPVKKCKTKK